MSDTTNTYFGDGKLWIRELDDDYVPDTSNSKVSDASELEGIETPTAQPATLENIMVFATRHKAIQAELDSIAEYVAALTAEAKDIEEVKLPGVLTALGMSEFKLTDGSKVTVKPTFQGSVAVRDPDQRKLQLDWLIANDGQDLIKNKVSLTFNKGEDAEAKALMDILAQYSFAYEVAESVHAASLASFIKSKMANAEDVPLDVLKWRYFDKADIKAPPEKRAKKGKADDRDGET